MIIWLSKVIIDIYKNGAFIAVKVFVQVLQGLWWQHSAPVFQLCLCVVTLSHELPVETTNDIHYANITHCCHHQRTHQCHVDITRVPVDGKWLQAISSIETQQMTKKGDDRYLILKNGKCLRNTVLLENKCHSVKVSIYFKVWKKKDFLFFYTKGCIVSKIMHSRVSDKQSLVELFFRHSNLSRRKHT